MEVIDKDRVEGSLDVLSALQVTEDMAGLDAECKTLLHSKEILSVILRGTVEEYKECSYREIMGLIEADSITEGQEVSAGRTNTQIRGSSSEFVQLNEKAAFFDVLFRARNPLLSDETVQVNLHIDVEPQKTYRPGYPIEKRGLYYLARSLSSQLSLVLDKTDYNQLEKCYSIWICRDDIPKEEHNSVSFFEIANTKNIGNCTVIKRNYDLMTLVIIRLGDGVYCGKKDDAGFALLQFLNAVMYPHREGFMEIISDYIDFSSNEELWEEAKHMTGLGQSILEEGIEQGIGLGIEQGIERSNKLTYVLLEQQRLDDLKRSTQEPKFREQLFLEFGL